MSAYGTTPRRVEKPWGWELVWAETESYVGKLLHVRAGQAPVEGCSETTPARTGGDRRLRLQLDD